MKSAFGSDFFCLIYQLSSILTVFFFNLQTYIKYLLFESLILIVDVSLCDDDLIYSYKIYWKFPVYICNRD